MAQVSFDLYPAIDLRGGRCVRLLQGDYDREVRYDANPVEVAHEFAEAGCSLDPYGRPRRRSLRHC